EDVRNRVLGDQEGAGRDRPEEPRPRSPEVPSETVGGKLQHPEVGVDGSEEERFAADESGRVAKENGAQDEEADGYEDELEPAHAQDRLRLLFDEGGEAIGEAGDPPAAALHRGGRRRCRLDRTPRFPDRDDVRERAGSEPYREEQDRETERAGNGAGGKILGEMGRPTGRCELDRLPRMARKEAPETAAARPGEAQLERGERRGEEGDGGDAAHRRMRIEGAGKGRDEVQQTRHGPDAQHLRAEEREGNGHARNPRSRESHREKDRPEEEPGWTDKRR